jgi:hypothetical protein
MLLLCPSLQLQLPSWEQTRPNRPAIPLPLSSTALLRRRPHRLRRPRLQLSRALPPPPWCTRQLARPVEAGWGYQERQPGFLCMHVLLLALMYFTHLLLVFLRQLHRASWGQTLPCSLLLQKFSDEPDRLCKLRLALSHRKGDINTHTHFISKFKLDVDSNFQNYD